MASGPLQVSNSVNNFSSIYFSTRIGKYAVLIFYLLEDHYYTSDLTDIPCLQLSASMPLPALRWLLPW